MGFKEGVKGFISFCLSGLGSKFSSNILGGSFDIGKLQFSVSWLTFRSAPVVNSTDCFCIYSSLEKVFKGTIFVFRTVSLAFSSYNFSIERAIKQPRKKAVKGRGNGFQICEILAHFSYIVTLSGIMCTKESAKRNPLEKQLSRPVYKQNLFLHRFVRRITPMKPDSTERKMQTDFKSLASFEIVFVVESDNYSP